jgi:hypothetical protein
MLLQQQLQELRGEVKTAVPPIESATTSTTGSPQRRANRTNQTRVEQEFAQVSNGRAQKNGRPTTSPLQGMKSTSPLSPTALPNGAAIPTTEEPPISIPSPKSTESYNQSRATGSVQPLIASPVSPTPTMPVAPVTSVIDTQNSLQTTVPTATVAVSSTSVSNHENRDGTLMQVGDDDIAIFEQMRHQLIIWLRVEAIQSGLEIVDQTPPQLLELLHRQERYDETRLQVVSTLLNLANQVIKNGRVSVLDYKQALTFHLMHTRR